MRFIRNLKNFKGKGINQNNEINSVSFLKDSRLWSKRIMINLRKIIKMRKLNMNIIKQKMILIKKRRRRKNNKNNIKYNIKQNILNVNSNIK